MFPFVICTADETRTHTRHPWSERILSITNWKSIAFGLSLLAIFISKLRHSRTLLLVIKQINCSSSLYTFISLLMLGSPSGFLPQPNSSVILHKRFHLWEDNLFLAFLRVYHSTTAALFSMNYNLKYHTCHNYTISRTNLNYTIAKVSLWWF